MGQNASGNNLKEVNTFHGDKSDSNKKIKTQTVTIVKKVGSEVNVYKSKTVEEIKKID